MNAESNIENILNINLKNSSLDQITHPLLEQYQIKMFIKRDDLLHPIISGNKWRKLKYILQHALTQGYDHLISMGGAYSNHLHSLAFVCHKLNLKATAFIRGEEQTNPTINDLKDWGMDCVFINRSDFRELRKHKNHDSLFETKYSGYWIPEGACTQKALPGINELLNEIRIDFDTIATACGTGTTLAGLSENLSATKKAIGISALKNNGFIEKEVMALSSKPLENYTVFNNYHFGGFAKTNDKLSSFIEDFSQQTGIAIEPVYTGKLFYALFDLMKNNYFQKDQTVIAYHSGGLQGAR